MDNQSRSWPKSVIRRAATAAALCGGLAAVAVAAALGLAYLLDERGPTVDFSRRTKSPLASRRPSPDGETQLLRFAVASMVSAEPTFWNYRRLVQRVCTDVGRREAFVLRPSYAEVRETLESGRVDVAMVCTGTYARAAPAGKVQLLVQPVLKEGRKYRSLLLVPAGSPAHKVSDLRGKVMAFTDPESNTGHYVPCVMLAEMGAAPESFFCRVMFTGSHDRSIQAVALGIVDAAAVDSLVFASAKERDTSLANRVRVVWESESFGPPPVVVPAALDDELKQSVLRAFLALDQDEAGREILSQIGVQRFEPARPENYESARRLYERFAAKEPRR